MGKKVTLVTAGLVAVVMGLVLVIVAVVGSGAAGSKTGGTDAGHPGGDAPGSGGVQPGVAIPAAWLSLYQQAALTCTGLSWSVLAAIGTVETHSGQSTAPGVWSGANAAGAVGPMQFEPPTFAAYATVGPNGAQPPSPYDPVDAVYTAAALLCANGGGTPSSLANAIGEYNHSSTYVDTVLTLALAFGQDPGISGTVGGALSFAAQQLNTP
ncbi:MAG TPA: lytic transglycosylase domain-containing protein, partial [Acidimicrobiales bacterium]|nr:lytic transglycosylase domain-containing protein [Acidimicrobiales bacterium]